PPCMAQPCSSTSGAPRPRTSMCRPALTPPSRGAIQETDWQGAWLDPGCSDARREDAQRRGERASLETPPGSVKCAAPARLTGRAGPCDAGAIVIARLAL